MKRFMRFTLAVTVLLGACSEIAQQPLDPDAATRETPAERAQRRLPTILQKQPGASPMSLVTQDLNAGLTPADLAQALVGPGVTVSNVVYTGHNRAGGLFSGGTGIIGFEGGVILSSGCIANVVGPNTDPGITCVNETPGHPDLSAIAGHPTFDAAVLEFDFVPSTDRVFFRYVFASDEYNEFVGSQFNDVFGFFINGVNYAVVGDPPVPITINTINRGQPGTPPTNPQLYRNNDPFTPTFDGSICPPGGCFDTEMDGLTVVITLEAPVNPNVVNTMRLAIADAADDVLDSNVFIQGGTLAICANPVPLNEVWSTGTNDGTISLSSANVFAAVYNVEPYLPRTPQAGWVRFGPTWETGTPAQSYTLTDRNMDGNRDVVVTFSTSQLIANGHLGQGTQSVTVWGRDLTTGQEFCGTRSVTVVP
jgi:hypothetical protein